VFSKPSKKQGAKRCSSDVCLREFRSGFGGWGRVNESSLQQSGPITISATRESEVMYSIKMPLHMNESYICLKMSP
jgi:hypothetical protein